MSIVGDSIMGEDRLLVYIAGPMRSIPAYNFPAFDAAAARFRANGWEVINPADLDRQNGVTEHTDPLPPGFLRDAMRRDLAAICDCDAIALLPGWRKSAGVAVELALASLLKLQVLHAETCEPLTESVLQEAQRITRGDRNEAYGEPIDEHDRIAEYWSTFLGVPVTGEQVAMMMVLLKVARQGHAYRRDSLVDIAGYADCCQRIVEERKRRTADR